MREEFCIFSREGIKEKEFIRVRKVVLFLNCWNEFWWDAILVKECRVVARRVCLEFVIC